MTTGADQQLGRDAFECYEELRGQLDMLLERRIRPGSRPPRSASRVIEARRGRRSSGRGQDVPGCWGDSGPEPCGDRRRLREAHTEAEHEAGGPLFLEARPAAPRLGAARRPPRLTRPQGHGATPAGDREPAANGVAAHTASSRAERLSMLARRIYELAAAFNRCGVVQRCTPAATHRRHRAHLEERVHRKPGRVRGQLVAPLSPLLGRA